MNGNRSSTTVREPDISSIDAPDSASLPPINRVPTLPDIARKLSTGARRAALVGAFLVLLLPMNGRAEKANIATSCTCFAFEDIDGKPLQLPPLRNAPILNGRMSSPFGMRLHPILVYWALHEGIDFTAPSGTPILASAAGIIEEAGDKGSFGNFIRIRHTNAIATSYAHARTIAASIRPGVRVAKGDVLGQVGSTGLSTGPHLHYEILVTGKRIKPICACVPLAPRTTPASNSAADLSASRNVPTTLRWLAAASPTPITEPTCLHPRKTEATP